MHIRRLNLTLDWQHYLEHVMKRLDDGKVSLVEFLRSIQFARQQDDSHPVYECPAQFAHFKQRAGAEHDISPEDSKLIRSAN